MIQFDGVMLRAFRPKACPELVEGHLASSSKILGIKREILRD
jgi:hypothetical protein